MSLRDTIMERALNTGHGHPNRLWVHCERGGGWSLHDFATDVLDLVDGDALLGKLGRRVVGHHDTVHHVITQLSRALDAGGQDTVIVAARNAIAVLEDSLNAR